MPLKILDIIPDSLTAGKLKPGDIILSINGRQISDFLDLQFHGSDEKLIIKFSRNGNKTEEISIQQDWESPLGIEPVPHRCRTCANNCIFCFVDQMRPDFRQTLYVKDDDYRLSFVYGNFITLTNLTKKDLDRIIEQRLSPLYVSVHTTDPVLHRKMLRYKHDFDILETLYDLGQNKIELHTQIVVVPGWNDGIALEKTLTDLTSSKINSLSIGIVPVGLSKYRKGLLQINQVDSNIAQKLLNQASGFPNTYCSDEIYLLANHPIPPVKFYNDFPQLENGIGMIRLLLENWQQNRDEFLKDIKRFDKDLVLITGVSAFAIITSIAKDIEQAIGKKARVQKVVNNFLGNSVTVAGLLSGRDIIEQTHLAENEMATISSAVFNSEGKTLDNNSESGLKNQLNNSLIIIDEEFNNWKFI